MTNLLKSLIAEYGLVWTMNRALYSSKLKMMKAVPSTEMFFEKQIEVKRTDIIDLDVDEIKNFLVGLSEEKKTDIISIADKATRGVITGFSSLELDFGNPINWHYNPLTDRESKKNEKWYRIPDFDSELGDIKVIWEASRFTHFYYFSRAYLITGDEKYYLSFSRQLEEWLENNLYSYGANFKCGQECTLRMINALMAYTIFEKSGLVTKNDKKNLFKLIEVCYKKVLSNFFYAHKCIKNNHTFTEISGLILGAWCCEDDEKLKKAYRLLDKEIRNQFRKDGGFTQYSFNYQRFTLQIIEFVYLISHRTQLSIKEKEIIKNSVLLMYQTQAENGDVPNYGSNDGALIFPVTTCGYRDFRPVLNTVYALIEGERLYDNGDYDEELLWFAGNRDIPRRIIKRESSSFEDSGFFTLRHKDGFLMTCLQKFDSRPAHMDQLHIDVWHKGINLFCDSGTYSYASELGNMLSSTAGHNTVQLPEVDQMNKKGAFLVTDWTERKQSYYKEHRYIGKMASANDYEHTRTINLTDKGYDITDNVSANSKYFSVYFHTPCEVKVVETGFELYENRRLICKVTVDQPIEIRKSYRSLYYLRKEEINCIAVRKSMKGSQDHINFSIELY